jgi:HK97 family phage major capsid protein
MLNIAALERDVQSKADAAQSLLARTMQTAEKENRVMTEEERGAINAKGAEAKAARDLLDLHRSDLALFRELETLAKPVGTGMTPAAAAKSARARGLSLGQQFLASEAWQFHEQKGHRSGSAWRSPVSELFPRDWHMNATTLTEDPTSGGVLVTPDYQTGILQLPTRPLVIADLLAPGTTASNLVSFMREKTWTNAADAVAEGAAKPESALVFEAATSPVRKIAHWLPVTEEMLEDAPQIQSYIDARLSLGVQLAEDNELLNGSGVAPHLLGILATPGLTPDLPKAVAPETNADVLAKQTMLVFAASYLMPDGYVLHPTNWGSTVLLKNSQGTYFIGSPFASSLQQASLWGLPVAVTPSITVGTGLVGAFKTAAQIFRHGGIRVESSNSHQDYFVKNLVAIRAEERLALAVYRPKGFGTVSALA